jgi:ABC-type lipoprotein release transport system permease subunit
MLATDLLIAGRNLRQHTRRNLALGGAIALVAALLVLFIGLVGGIKGAMLESAATIISGHVNVGGFFKITSGAGGPLVTDVPKVMADVRRLVPEAAFFTVRGRGYAKVVSDATSQDLVLSGVEVDKELGIRKVLTIQSGRLDDLAQPNTILLFEKAAERLQVKVGDALTVAAPTARNVSNTIDVKVVAIARNVGLLSTFVAFLPEQTLRALYLLNDKTTGAIHVYLKDPDLSPRIAARLLTDLRAAGYDVMDYDPQPYWMKLMQKINSEDWTGQKLDVTSWEDEMSFLNFMLQIVTGLAAILIGVLLFIVVIGIMNTLWIAIRERTREIGTLRAIGMQRVKVAWLLLLEAGLLGFVGSLTGVLAGWAAAAGINGAGWKVGEGLQMILMQDHFSVLVRPVVVVGSVVGLTCLTGAAALLPALRAARLRPVTAMHHIG